MKMPNPSPRLSPHLGPTRRGPAALARRLRQAVSALGVLLAVAVPGWTATATVDATASAPRPEEFPTLDRVVYVQECMRAHPGPGYEMTSKCACVLDNLAHSLSYDEFVTMNTVSKATTIAGERGGTIRDAPGLAAQLTRYRSLQAQAEQGCFIGPNSR